MMLTGATGLIGHWLLARLLRSGVRCAAVVRDPGADATRLEVLLAANGVSATLATACEQLVLVRGDLLRTLELQSEHAISDIIHLAGCTRFHNDANGDPIRTNVGGTRRLLEWASRQHIGRIHLVSTAYVGGRTHTPIPEEVLVAPVAFHNDYECSKWTSEQLCKEWEHAEPSRAVTILRPSIVVGDWATGRTTSFSGLYVAIRAIRAAAQFANRSKRQCSRALDLRLPMSADGAQNIVPVNYVADMIASIVMDPKHHGGVYNLVHHTPPTNVQIRNALQQTLGVDGLNFGQQSSRTRIERLFDRAIEPIKPYLEGSTRFARDRTSAVERTTGVICPTYDMPALMRICEFAVHDAPATLPIPDSTAAGAAEYFEQFLPRFVAQSTVAKLISLSANVRFALTGIADGHWLCSFDSGRLVRVLRSKNGTKEDFGYRVDAETFLKVVAAELDPQQAFLNGQVEVFGDVERALKMAMVLRQFNSEFPFRNGSAQKGGAHA